ncbi:RNA-binding cell elongation regulator Jag/EloR [Kroppenstedtia eburnea]|uniref:RNA-binding protein KhpB n=1 Tax=Kroppenstedtia eburnea TaxID=714067 RepID=A0A1N7JH85_9BACL|nr:RNA-binding cell elongation regulator Jag/EloR [Kroppenstedtia eburnea]EGK10161.1 SpoIIIJ-associated protein Jag [Desmospora sp. 8437]QKI83607.1 protein jag [Kroppenstedtia eburnea]SIS48752.1 spoIIIJ-associated protein [Kroppenstedtia eburnea]
MKKLTVTGKTVEAAVEEALRRLGATRDQVEISVLEEASRGFLGWIGSREAKVEVKLIPTPLEQGLSFLRSVLDRMGLKSVRLEVKEEPEHTWILLSGDHLGMLIGRRGQTLDALQYLVNVAAHRNAGPYTRIVLDAQGYRERRRQTLMGLADRIAEKVTATGSPLSLEPMNPMERKVIHTRIQQKHAGVVTYSEGEDPRRHVVVAPKTDR